MIRSADVLGSVDTESKNPILVLFQSGYMTIKGYDSEFKTYILGFPNEEVEVMFVKFGRFWTRYQTRTTPFLSPSTAGR